jgi:SAM-dependent methyltransferase
MPDRTTFAVPADSYEEYMGAWSRPLAESFVSDVGVRAGQHVLDVGCGTGALTAELVRRVASGSVAAVDPSPQFTAACAAANPTVDVRLAGAEQIPFADGSFDGSLSQLAVNFMADAATGIREMRRVTRAGGVVAACTWDYSDGMTMLRVFWDAAASLDPATPHEGRTMPYCDPVSLERLWRDVGLEQVRTGQLTVSRTYDDFDHYWSTFELGVGPGGAYCNGLTSEQRSRLREECFRRLGEPSGPLPLTARAWVVAGTS